MADRRERWSCLWSAERAAEACSADFVCRGSAALVVRMATEGAMEVEVLDASTGEARWSARALAMKPSDDGRLALLYGRESGSDLQLLDLATGDLLAGVADAGSASSLHPATDGRHAVTGHPDGAIRAWDLAAGRKAWEGEHGAPVVAVCALPAGIALSAGVDGALRCWRLEDGRPAWSMEGLSMLVLSGAGERIVTLDEEATTLTAWRSTDGAPLWRASTEGMPASGLQAALEGDAVVAVTHGLVRVLDGACGRTLTVFERHSTPVTAVAISPDGRVAGSGDASGEVFVWEAATGRVLAGLGDHRGGVRGLSLRSAEELLTIDASGLVSRGRSRSVRHRIRRWTAARPEALPSTGRAPAPWRTVAVFVSSTFNDMHAERDLLVKDVFPRLAEWCEARRLHLVDVDLRWGVTEADATHNRRVVEVCLGRIDECRPFFVCLLGQRYGWIPRPEDVPPETLARFPGLAGAIASGCSVTEMEILHGALAPFGPRPGAAPRALFFARDPAALDELPPSPPALARIYADDLPERRRRLVDLIAAARFEVRTYSARWSATARTPELARPLSCTAAAPENVARWRGEWRDDAGVVAGGGAVDDPAERSKAERYNARLTSGRLVEFSCRGAPLADAILDELRRSIAGAHPDHAERPDDRTELERELDQQEEFVASASRGLVERPEVSAGLDAYLAGTSPRPLVLAAAAGSGKSALLASWIARARRLIEAREGGTIHAWFVGASDGSSSLGSLLRSIAGDLERSGKLGGPVPGDARALREAWPELLAEAASRGPTVLVVDAINQLESGTADLEWIPRELAEGSRWIVSLRSDTEDGARAVEALRASGSPILAVPPFAPGERAALVRAYLAQYFKELDPHHERALIEAPGSANPLYLKILLSELRVFGAFARLGEKIRADFGETAQTAFDAVLRRLEADARDSDLAPRSAVPSVLALLAHARQGLSSTELAEVAGAGEGVPAETARPAVERVLRQLRPFLGRREGRHVIFYESLLAAAGLRYVSSPEVAVSWHRRLARYFHSLPLRDGQGRPTRRRVSELPYHLVRAEDWPALEATLADLEFVSAKVQAGLVDGLGDDYDAALAAHPEGRAASARDAERQGLRVSWARQLAAFAEGTAPAVPRIDAALPPGEPLPAPAPSGLDRLASFARFVRAESHRLRRHGGDPAAYVLQQAHNAASEGPVAQAARGALSLPRPGIRILSIDPPPPAACAALLGTIECGAESVRLDRDGRRLLAAGGSLVLADVATGRSRTVVEAPAGPRHAVCQADFAGEKVVLACRSPWHDDVDGTLRVWDLAASRPDLVLRGHASAVRGVRATPDGRLAVSCGDDGTLRVWDLRTGECLRVLGDREVPLGAISLSADGRTAIAGRGDGRLAVWDLAEGRHLGSLEGHPGPIGALGMTPDARWCVSGAGDGARIWDLTAGACRQVIPGEGAEHGVAITPDGRLVATAGREIRLWDARTGACLRSFSIGACHGVELSADGRVLVSWNEIAGTIRIWDPEGPSLVEEDLPAEARRPSLVPAGPGSALVAWGGAIGVVDLATGAVPAEFLAPIQDANAIDATPDGGLAATADGSSLAVWDLAQGERLASFPFSGGGRVRLSRDGRLAAAATGNAIQLFAIPEGPGRLLEGHAWTPCDMVFVAGGRFLLSGGRDGTVRLWEVASGRCVRRLEGHAASVARVEYLRQTRRALSVGTDDRIGLEPWQLEIPEFREREKRAAPGDDGATMRLWDLRAGRCLSSIRPGGRVVAVRVGPDERTVAIADAEGACSIWDLDTGRETRRARVTTGSVWQAAISDDLSRAALAIGDEILLVDLTAGLVEGRLPLEQEDAALALAGDRLVVSTPRHRIRVHRIEGR